MVDDTARSLILFFYFSFLDDELSLKLARRAADAMKISASDTHTPHVAQFIKTTFTFFRDHTELRKFKVTQRDIRPPYFLSISQADLEHWYSYWKIATDEELVSLIWIKILKFNEDEVAGALGVTKGTLGHRLSRGLAQAGSAFSA